MNELIETLNTVQGEELQKLIVLLKNIGRISAAGTFLMAFAHLFVIYRRGRQKGNAIHRSGIVFLMLGVLIWFGMATSKLFFQINPGDLSIYVLFSTFNNGFLIASLPFIGNGFLWIRKIKLFRNRLVWVISALILCMSVSLLLILVGRMDPVLSNSAEIGFSMLSMTLFGYAAFISFKSVGAKAETLLIVAIAPIGYALLQLILNHTPTEQVAQFWIFRTVAVVIANSAMAGMLLLTSANLILGNLEEVQKSTKAQLKKLEDELLHSKTHAEALVVEARELHEMLLEKDRIIQAMQEEAAQSSESIHLHRITIGFDNSSLDKYILELDFVFGKEEVRVRCANSKLTVPHAHWIIFAVARKNGITLKHPDIAQSKFQMIKYLNAFTGKHKISKEHVFRNNGGEFDISIDRDSILFEDIGSYSSHLQLLETFKRYWHSFGVPGGGKNSNESLHEALTGLLKSA